VTTATLGLAVFHLAQEGNYIYHVQYMQFNVTVCNISPGRGIIIIIIIIIIILGFSFMHGIYTYIPETNHVPREHRVATILM
jgi:hypothetical protein